MLQLFVDDNQPLGEGYEGCVLEGIPLGGDRYLANLGSILLAILAILVTLYLLFRSQRKPAAVGRREIQIFLIAYIITQICEIFSVGGIPIGNSTRQGFSAVHVAAFAAMAWLLFLNALVGFQLLDDGTKLSTALFIGSALAVAIGTGYIALDVAFSLSGFFDSTREPPYEAIALFVLYLLFPLLCFVAFFVLEAILVLRVLGEKRPMRYLILAALSYIIAKLFQFVISTHICNSTDGKIDGALFETLFTLLAVAAVWQLWNEITEDDWQEAMPGSTYPGTNGSTHPGTTNGSTYT